MNKPYLPILGLFVFVALFVYAFSFFMPTYEFVENEKLRAQVHVIDKRIGELSGEEIALEQIRLCDEAIKKNSMDATAHRMKGFALVMLASFRGPKGEPEPQILKKAKREINFVKRYTPNHPHVLVLEASYFEKQAYVDTAIEYYTKAYPLLGVETDRDRERKGSIASTIGYMYYIKFLETKSSDYASKSLAMAEESIAIGGEDAWYYMVKGMALLELEYYKEAMKAFQKALDLYKKVDDEGRASAFGRMGEVQYRMQNYGDALTFFSKAAELNPKVKHFQDKKKELERIVW